MQQTDGLTEKVQAVVRDCPYFITTWFFDNNSNQVVFRRIWNGDTTEFRLGYAAVSTLPHSTMCEWLRQSVQGGIE